MLIEPYAYQTELTVSGNVIHENIMTTDSTQLIKYEEKFIKWVTVTNNHKFPNSTTIKKKQITPEDNEHLTLQLYDPAKTMPWAGCYKQLLCLCMTNERLYCATSLTRQQTTLKHKSMRRNIKATSRLHITPTRFRAAQNTTDLPHHRWRKYISSLKLTPHLNIQHIYHLQPLYFALK